HFAYSVVVGLTGIVIGWLIGVLVSPFRWEESKFTDYGKALVTFVSGYVLSKIDPLIRAATGEGGALSEDYLFRIGLFTICLGCSLIGMYIFRRYVAIPVPRKH